MRLTRKNTRRTVNVPKNADANLTPNSVKPNILMGIMERYAYNGEYETIFGASLRIMVASIIAYIISQYHDIWAFEFWKAKTKGRFLWLRNNFSTIVSQAIDTLIFMFIAFYHLTPKFDALFILELAIPYYLFKIAFAIMDTPFIYLGVRWLKTGKKR